MLYCCDCKYYDRTKEHFEERKIFYTDEKYDITYDILGWCNRNNCEVFSDCPLECCNIIMKEHLNNEEGIDSYLKYYGEFYE